jgi:hypothetical protein
MREKKNLVLLALSAIVFATTVISVPSVFSEINPGAPSSQINRAGGASIDDGVLIQDNQVIYPTKTIKTEKTKEEQDQEWLEQNKRFIKSYTLKYISASDFISVAKMFTFVGTSSGNTLSVIVSKATISDFEELLKRLDVEKKSIRFQFFPVIAYRERPNRKESLPEGTAGISNKELRTVLDEVKKIWNFRYFETDFPSFLNVREGAESNSLQLVSKLATFNLTIVQPQIRGEKAGERNIYVKQIRLNMTANFTTLTPIDSQDLSFRENGYLVVGVGGTGYLGGDAVILVVSAEIK